MFINKTLVFQQSPGIPLPLSTLPLASNPPVTRPGPRAFSATLVGTSSSLSPTVL